MLAKREIVWIHVSLRRFKKVWRELLVPRCFTLEQLHLVIDAAFNWQSIDQASFRLRGGLYFSGVAFGCILWDRPRLYQFFGQGKHDSFHYSSGNTLCDSPYSWDVVITLESVTDAERAVRTARCVGGRGFSPPMELKRVQYCRLLQRFTDPNHPEHADALAQLGHDFDPEVFDLVKTNLAVEAAAALGDEW